MGRGAEYKRVKDLSHRETVFQIGVKKEIKLSEGKYLSPTHAESTKH